MGATQTTTPTAPSAALEGQLASADARIASYFNGEATASIPFGRMVKQGTADDEALLVSAQGDRLVGIVVRSQAYEKGTQLKDDGLAPGQEMAVLLEGVVWVKVTDAVSPGAPVRVDAVGGTFQTAAEVGVTMDISKFARWLSSAGAGGLAKLYIDMTGEANKTSD